jgi:hypothetical protein
MRKPTSWRALTLVPATAVVASLVVAGPAEAKTRHDFAPPPNPIIIASGLDNPRGLAFGPDGRLYVVEAGRGGDGPCFPGGDGTPACFGLTGAVTALDNPQDQHRVLYGLPSYGAPGSGDFAIGPSSIAFQSNGRVFLTEGLGLDLSSRAAGLPELDPMGQLLRLRIQQQDWSAAADLAAYEATANPTGDELDSNPNDVIADGAGQVVVDAGANDLLRVDPNGRVSTIATFPAQTVSASRVDGLPPGTDVTFEAVPTSVAKGPDGAYYVGQLTGYPFLPGAASIFRVADTPGAKPDPVSQGLTNVIAVAFDGPTLYAVEIYQNGLLSGDDTGALVRIDLSTGKPDTIYSGMPSPAGLTIKDGVAYLSVCGTCAGGGKVLSITLPT